MALNFTIRFGYEDEGDSELSVLNKYKISRELFEMYFHNNENYKILDEKRSDVVGNLHAKRIDNVSKGFHHKLNIENYFFEAYFESYKACKGCEGNLGSLKLTLNAPRDLSDKIRKLLKREVQDIDPKLISSIISKYM